jgi:hypothetical protein
VTQDWTNNIDALETGVNRLRPGGGTRCTTPSTPPAATSCSTFRAARSRCARPWCSSPTATTTRAASIPTKPSRSASAPRPSSTPSAPTGRPAAARRQGAHEMAESTGGARLLPALGGRDVQQLQGHRRRAAQPVRADYTPADFKRTAPSAVFISIATTAATRCAPRRATSRRGSSD